MLVHVSELKTALIVFDSKGKRAVDKYGITSIIGKKTIVLELFSFIDYAKRATNVLTYIFYTAQLNKLQEIEYPVGCIFSSKEDTSKEKELTSNMIYFDKKLAKGLLIMIASVVELREVLVADSTAEITSYLFMEYPQILYAFTKPSKVTTLFPENLFGKLHEYSDACYLPKKEWDTEKFVTAMKKDARIVRVI